MIQKKKTDIAIPEINQIKKSAEEAAAVKVNEMKKVTSNEESASTTNSVSGEN
mgnify:CR=1 FL=1